MRFVALFLSIIVFTLTIMPCCAVEGSERPAKVSTEKECDNKTGDCCNDCSPFYVCGACAGFTLTNQHVITLNMPTQPLKHNTAYLPVKLPLIPLAIWQPPKLS